jgi:predicted DNA-binding transcriptional regulator AlpA
VPPAPPDQRSPHGLTDDSAAPVPLLPIYLRFRDLKASNVVASWTQLARMVDDEGFPAGVWLSANIRAWKLTDVQAWLERRPVARKAVPEDARHPRARKRADAARRFTKTTDNAAEA